MNVIRLRSPDPYCFSLTWYMKCPKDYPNFDSAWMIHIGKPPYELGENTFPWESRDCKNGKQVFNVPTRCSNPWSGLDRIRLCYKCCKKDTCE